MRGEKINDFDGSLTINAYVPNDMHDDIPNDILQFLSN